MRCLIAISLLLSLVSAFQGPSLRMIPKNKVSTTLSMMMMDDDDDSSSSSEPTTKNSITRRQAFETTLKGSSFLAAALAAGAPPALAADISKQVAQLEREFKDTVNTDGAPEKHIPQVTLSQKDGMNMVKVVVPHVMDAEKPHWIQAIWLKEETTGDVAVAKVFPATEPGPPSLICGVPKGGATLTPYLYCNIHGLWKGDTFSV
jgi:desulfoferrodoxin (superoxide reductase-like protein)